MDEFQLRALLARYEELIGSLEEQRRLLEGSIAEAEDIIRGLEALPEGGGEAMVPLGRGVLLRATLGPRDKVLYYAGSDVYVAHPVQEVIGRLRERIRVLREALDGVNDRLAQLAVEYRSLLSYVRVPAEEAKGPEK